MHSKIFQIGLKPMTEDDYIRPEDLYDNSGDYADYIGDEFEGNGRIEAIQGLAEDLKELFDYAGDGTLVYKGMGTFLEDWANEIKDMARELTQDNILKELRLFRLSKITYCTHLDLNARFYIDVWNGCAGPASDFIEFLAKQTSGTRLYIGSVIDFHF